MAAPPPPAIQQKINLTQRNKFGLGASAGFSRSHSGQSTLRRFASNFHKLIKTPVPFHRIGSDAFLMHLVSARCRGLRHGDVPYEMRLAVGWAVREMAGNAWGI